MLCCQSNSSPPECTCWRVKVHLQANCLGQERGEEALTESRQKARDDHILPWQSSCPPSVPLFQPSYSQPYLWSICSSILAPTSCLVSPLNPASCSHKLTYWASGLWNQRDPLWNPHFITYNVGDIKPLFLHMSSGSPIQTSRTVVGFWSNQRTSKI